MSEFGLDSKVVIEETINDQDIHDLKSFITDKNYPYVADQQNGSYSNQVSFDLSSIVSNNAYLNLQNSYILMPMSVSMNSTNAWGASIPPSAIEMKSNFVNLIDSIQVFINNKQLVDQTTMSNLPVSILSKLEMSSADLKLEGRGLGIFPDTYSAVGFSLSADVSGDGYFNNQLLLGSATDAIKNKTQNNGIVQRNAMFVNASSISDNTKSLPAINTTSALTRAVSCQSQGLPYFSSGSTANQAAAWNFIAYIPLRRLSDLFARMPLIKNSQVRLVLNLNLGAIQISHSSTAMSLTSINQTAGSTFPVMFNQVSATSATLPTLGSTTLSIAVQPNTSVPSNNGVTGASYGYPLLPQCRVYCQSMVVNPTYEERILANSKQTIRYLDWFQLSINNVSKGSSFTQTISTAIPNAAIGIIVPFHNGSVVSGSGGLFAAITGNQYQSPFDAAPEQSLPLGMAAFSQLNFQVNGNNVWNNNAQFTYDIFCQEIKSLSLNGSLKRDLASGLMDLVDWQFSPVAICDLGDRIDAQSDAYQSIVVSGTNGSNVAVDYKVFIGYWKTYSIDVITGQMEKIF